MKLKYYSILLIFIISIIFYIPVIINPDLVLNRNNDLQEQFWPIFYLIKSQIITNHVLPLWNNLFFSGLPLLPDPQFSMFYPPNILFVLLPINLGFLISFILHTFFAGIGFYLLAKHFVFTNKMALLATSLYMFSPRLGNYLEAGHFGLVASWAWLPFLFLATLNLAKKPNVNWSLLFALSLAGLFYTHIVTFVWALAFATALFGFNLLLNKSFRKVFTKLPYLLLGLLLGGGLSAVTLIPQINWLPETTRLILFNNPDVYPKWLSKVEFLKAIFWPWILQPEKIWSIDTEKWLTLGLTPLILAIIGFWKISRKYKIVLFLIGIIIVLLSLNNTSPIYSLLMSQSWYILGRVATRVWFIPAMIVPLLAVFVVEKYVSKIKIIFYFLILILIIESLTLSWVRLMRPIQNEENIVPYEILQVLKNDKSRFRVFCLNRCIPQKLAVEQNLELVEGYNTIGQFNYYKHMWQLSGAYWNYYTLALPPIGSYTFEKLKPDAVSLGAYNVKYVIAPYPLNDSAFSLIKQTGNYYLYLNSLEFPRAYFRDNANKGLGVEAKILNYTPNWIKVDTSAMTGKSLILAEVYSPGWKAYLNGQEETLVRETPSSLRQINLKSDTKFVDFKYDPHGYNFGRIISLVTLIFIAFLVIIERKKLKWQK